ncbi:MAG: sigma-70 family RNA polymerase sigma factor [Bacteroidota bacterium]
MISPQKKTEFSYPGKIIIFTPSFIKEKSRVLVFSAFLMSPERSKDKRADFERVFLSNYQLLFNIGFSICKDRDLSKDMIQSFFLELWEKELWKKEIQDIPAYLSRSFYRKAIRLYTAQKKLNTNLTYKDQEVPIPSFESLLIQSQEQEHLQQKLSKAIEELPNKQQEVLKLRFEQGMAYEEIAFSRGKSKQTIYNQINAALKKLKEGIIPSLLFLNLF